LTSWGAEDIEALVGSGSFGVCLAETPRLSTAALGKFSYYSSLLAHTQKSQRVKIRDIFSKTHENQRSLDSLDQSPALGRSKVISYLISQRKSDTLGFHSNWL